MERLVYAGIAVGAAFIIIVLLATTFLCCRNRLRKRHSQTSQLAEEYSETADHIDLPDFHHYEAAVISEYVEPEDNLTIKPAENVYDVIGEKHKQETRTTGNTYSHVTLPRRGKSQVENIYDATSFGKECLESKRQFKSVENLYAVCNGFSSKTVIADFPTDVAMNDD